MIPHSKVFIGGLPSGSKPHELRRLFENYGVVTECDIMNRCGFVHMESPQMADNAIRGLHNTTFKGAVISVEPGRPKDRNRSGGGGGSGGMGRGGPVGGPNQRMGGGGGGDNIGPMQQRTNFDNARAGPGTQGPPKGRQAGGSNFGPMRRDRNFNGGPRRGPEPYSRDGRRSGNNYQEGFQSGGNRNFDLNDGPNNFNSGPMNNFSGPGGNMGMDSFGGARNSGGNFGMGNQDKRGFALPDQSFSNNCGPMLGPNQNMGMVQGGGGGGSFGNNSNSFNRSGGMNASPNRGGGFGGNSSPFNRSAGNGNMNQANRQYGQQGRGGPMNQGGCQNQGGFPLNQNYNEAFPPLGVNRGNSGGRNGPPGFRNNFGIRNGGFNRGGNMGNRNGPPRRDNMMSNRR